MNAEVRERKPGRPRAVPESAIPDVFRLYDGGLGYRAIARELAKRGVSADWSTVRQVIKSRRSGGSAKNDLYGTFYTILTLGMLDDAKKSMGKGSIGARATKNTVFQRVKTVMPRFCTELLDLPSPSLFNNHKS